MRKNLKHTEMRNELQKEGEALLCAVNKDTERTKKEVVNKACEFIKEKVNDYIVDIGVGYGKHKFIVGGRFIEDFRKAMEE